MRIRLRVMLPILVMMVILNMSYSTATTPTPTPAPEPTAIPVPDGYALTWHDEFDAEAIDPKNWTYDIGGSGWGNNELEFYTKKPENAYTKDGLLVIEARQEGYMGMGYTSARLLTQKLQTFQYGRIEARLKVPSGAGLWPAFWMLGENITSVGWPTCGEIDIMEYIGREPNTILGTLHGPGYSGAEGITQWVKHDYAIADDFHTFAVEWDSEQFTWYYDGEIYHTVTRADVGANEWVFDKPFFIILNLAVGGNLGGTIAAETVFPAQYLVDYVRVFQK